jgi:LacI family transcriptional regulator
MLDVPMRSTIKEVAHRAGVSTATVSRVFNNSPLVVDDTRQRILKVANDLRYHPNPLARSLSTQKAHSIGLLLPDLYGEFFSEVIRGVDQIVQEKDNHLLVSSSHSKTSEVESALKMMRGRVDGIIIMSPAIDSQTLHKNLPHDMPVILLNCYVEGDTIDSINVDNYGGSYEMVKHLASHGHTRIAIIKGTETNYDAKQRLKGYRSAVKESHCVLSTELEIEGDLTKESGYAAGKKILKMTPLPTAIFASNDSMAFGAISALKEEGVTIPNDMAIAGFDDIPIARFMQPKLSTVKISISEFGTLGAQRLYDAIENMDHHRIQHIIIPTELSLRESCGCQS